MKFWPCLHRKSGARLSNGCCNGLLDRSIEAWPDLEKESALLLRPVLRQLPPASQDLQPCCIEDDLARSPRKIVPIPLIAVPSDAAHLRYHLLSRATYLSLTVRRNLTHRRRRGGCLVHGAGQERGVMMAWVGAKVIYSFFSCYTTGILRYLLPYSLRDWDGRTDGNAMGYVFFPLLACMNAEKGWIYG